MFNRRQGQSQKELLDDFYLRWAEKDLDELACALGMPSPCPLSSPHRGLQVNSRPARLVPALTPKKRTKVAKGRKKPDSKTPKASSAKKVRGKFNLQIDVAYIFYVFFLLTYSVRHIVSDKNCLTYFV